jgi:FkbM family methyltransferase
VSLSDHEVVADGGTYNGDTLAEFVERVGGKYSHYHAFEPDSVNVASLRKRLEAFSPEMRNRITVHELALYSHRERLSFASRGQTNSQINNMEGEVRVEACSLDDVLQDSPLTFLKLDIEGAEVSALRGAETTIRRTQPLVAACVYHKPDDLWQIPLMLRDMLPNHRFGLRQHGFDGWETVCYAIPRH